MRSYDACDLGIPSLHTDTIALAPEYRTTFATSTTLNKTEANIVHMFPSRMLHAENQRTKPLGRLKKRLEQHLSRALPVSTRVLLQRSQLQPAERSKEYHVAEKQHRKDV